MSKVKTTGMGFVGLMMVACDPYPPFPPPHGRPYTRRPPPPYYEERFEERIERPYEPHYDPRREGPRQEGRREDLSRPVPTERPAPRDEYPVAERTDNPNQVISPYAPYNVIDVEGFKSGQLARDPSNKKIFRIP